MKRLKDIREALEIGTDKIVDEYKKATPGEDVVDPADKGEYDNEGEMAKTQLRGIVADASHMIQMFSDEQNLPEWVQNKITKSADYLNSAHRYMMNKESVEWVCGQCNCDPCTCEGNIHESVTDLQELDAQTQKKFSMGAKNMKAYAQKNGGVDKKDFMDVAKLLDQIARVNLLQAGQLLSRLNRLVDGMDTDVRERIYIELKKVGLVESIIEKADDDTVRMIKANPKMKDKILRGLNPKARKEIEKALEESLDEKAPKIDDKKFAAHMARNKKAKKMTSTQKSLSDISKRANEELDEAKFTDKQIKMAYGVANDKRYKGGNYSGAVRAIEKIAKGLSDHPAVKKVLKRTNENKVDESTAAYRKSQEKIANDRKKANIKPGELNKLAKIRAMLDREKKKK